MFPLAGNVQGNNIFPDYKPCVENTHNFAIENTDQFSLDFSTLDYQLNLDIDASPIIRPSVPSASLRIIQNYTRGIKRLCGTDFDPEPRVNRSTDEILRLAGEKFIQTSSRKVVTLPVIGLSQSEAKDVEIVQKLLFAAEKTGQKKYYRARKFLDQCDDSSSAKGNPVERIVYFFSKALREKIDREMGKVSAYKDSFKKQAMQIGENLMKASPVILALFQEIPFSQITIYAGMQVIIERVSGARRVHIIDLEIGSGLHTTVLMQALADRVECPIELLKITAVTTKSKQIVEETGDRLKNFAESISLPFWFNIVMVSDFCELSEELFDFESEETVAVSALYALRNLIGRQTEVESLMRILKSINPSVMVVTENEGKLNSPVFVNRFIEALFYYGTFFDCLEDIKGRDSQLRMQFESIYLGYGIRNVLVAEGDDRTVRHVNLGIWRKFFSGFDMKEEELSSASVLQASLVAKTYACWNSCTIYKDERSLIAGWKGMPLQHVSAWTFPS